MELTNSYWSAGIATALGLPVAVRVNVSTPAALSAGVFWAEILAVLESQSLALESYESLTS